MIMKNKWIATATVAAVATTLYGVVPSGIVGTAHAAKATQADCTGGRFDWLNPLCRAQRPSESDRAKSRQQIGAGLGGSVKVYAGSKAKGAGVTPDGFTSGATMAPAFSKPDYFAIPNWLNSPLPEICDGTDTTAAGGSCTSANVGTIQGGMRKFVDTLPGFCNVSNWVPNGTNNLGQCLPVGVPDTATYPGSDYYQIELTAYSQKMHSDLPATRLLGYRQVGTPNQYLGPFIIATRGKPVRVKFINNLAEDPPVPVDTSYTGAGDVFAGTAANPLGPVPASNRRATLHLHGGLSPWISDGIPHTWVAPSSEACPSPGSRPQGSKCQPWNASYNNGSGFMKGVSFKNVPDMGAGSVTDGTATYYWTNDQSGRLMFYHDHVSALTRLNVYAGEAAGYLLVDPYQEQQLKANGNVPGTIPVPGNLADPSNDLTHVIPVVFQDKTFVPDNGEPGGQTASMDPTWDVAKWGKGNLWFPHIYMPNQMPPSVQQGSNGANIVNPYGRWDLGVWTPLGVVTNNPTVACTTAANIPSAGLTCPPMPNPTGTPESFEDTPLINGTVYPTVSLKPSAYRWQILNAANDRWVNLGIFFAATAGPEVTLVDHSGTGSGALVRANVSGGEIKSYTVLDPGEGYTSGSVDVYVNQLNGGTGAKAVATVAVNGSIDKVEPLDSSSWGAGYIAGNKRCENVDEATAKVCTEVFQEAPQAHVGSSTLGSGSNPILPAVCRGSDVPPVPGRGQVTAVLKGDGSLQYRSGFSDKCWPDTWPNDGGANYGLVPSPLEAGPPMIQIAAEGGLLPKPAVLPAHASSMLYDRKMATVLTLKNYGLLMGPAVRADVVVDFHEFAPSTGKSVFILYNDGRAPGPLFDLRYDYHTGDRDFSFSGDDIGGAPSTIAGYGPNTRTLMRMEISGSPDNTPVDLAALTTNLPTLFAQTQEQIILPGPAYPPGNGYSSTDTVFTAMQTEVPIPTGGPLSGVKMTYTGSGYTTAPTVGFVGGCTPEPGCVATGTASLLPTSVASVPVVTTSTTYSTPPTVGFNGGGGTGATGVATMKPSWLSGLNVTNGGSGYTTAPTVTLTGGGGSGATATAAITMNRRVSSVTLNNRGTLYTAAPAVVFNPAGATATATLQTSGSVATITGTVTGSCAGRSTTSPVTFTGGGGTGAAATATISGNRRTVTITMTNRGTGYTSAPTVRVTNCTSWTGTARLGFPLNTVVVGNGGSYGATSPTISFTRSANDPAANVPPARVEAVATAVMQQLSTGFVSSLNLTAPGSGYTSAPTVVISGGGGSGAAGSASLFPVAVASVAVTNGGAGYTTPPILQFNGVDTADPVLLAPTGVGGVTLTSGGNGYTTPPDVIFMTAPGDSGTGAAGMAQLTPKLIDFKGIVEGFSPTNGGMYAQLGAAFQVLGGPFAAGAVPFAYVDPGSDVMGPNETQVWKVEHLGVDSHPVHVHLFNVQLKNTVDLAGQLFFPDPNELGWKETIHFHPFQDGYMALKPIKPNLPFDLPASRHVLDPTLPLGTTNQPLAANQICANNPFPPPPQAGQVLINCLPFSPTDPLGNAVTTTNSQVNFGWEYVWHCHILGHEEYDMMRPISFTVPPIDPTDTRVKTPPAPQVTYAGSGNNRTAFVTFKDWSMSEDTYELQYSNNNGRQWTTVTTANRTAAESDATGASIRLPATGTVRANGGNQTVFRLRAASVIGCQNNCSTPAGGWPVSSVFSNYTANFK